jgi:hypothetical protein
MIDGCWIQRFVGQLACVAVLAVFLSGCDGSGLATHPVSGTVTVDGQPATDMRVDFHPVDPSNQMASGTLDSGGKYTLFTGQTGTPGAMAGRYKVVLTPTMADTSYMDGPAAGAPQGQSGGVPSEYTSVDTTPEEVEVTAGSNTINIEI